MIAKQKTCRSKAVKYRRKQKKKLKEDILKIVRRKQRESNVKIIFIYFQYALVFFKLPMI